jgi:hypothetical protein
MCHAHIQVLALIKMNILQKTIYILFFIILFACQNNSKKDNDNNSQSIKAKDTTSLIDSNFIVDKYEKKFDWSKIETEINETEKSRLIELLKTHYDYFLNSQFYKDDFAEKLHFADINNDNKIDVIFNGWSGGEPDIIRFFIQSENGFDKWFEILQNPLEIRITNNRIDEIIAIDNGCCDAYQVTISKYKVSNKLNLISQTSYIDWTDMNGTIIEPAKFKIINDTYFIRDSPKIDNETENERFETKGNSIGEFLKGQKGTAYKSSTDSTGRVWWLMESEPLDSLQNSYFYNESKIKTSFIGWISSRYVERINN